MQTSFRQLVIEIGKRTNPQISGEKAGSSRGFAGSKKGVRRVALLPMQSQSSCLRRVHAKFAGRFHTRRVQIGPARQCTVGKQCLHVIFARFVRTFALHEGSIRKLRFQRSNLRQLGKKKNCNEGDRAEFAAIREGGKQDFEGECVHSQTISGCYFEDPVIFRSRLAFKRRNGMYPDECGMKLAKRKHTNGYEETGILEGIPKSEVVSVR